MDEGKGPDGWMQPMSSCSSHFACNLCAKIAVVVAKGCVGAYQPSAVV